MGTVQVNITRQTDSFKNKLDTLVKAYNEVIAYVKTQTAYDAATKTAGILMGDASVKDVQERLRSPLMSQVSGFTKGVDSFVMPGHIGLEVDSKGLLKLDTTKLSDAIAKDYTAVLDLIGAVKAGSSDSNAIKFYGANNNTVAGTYNVEVTFDNGAITAARIKLSSESIWRNATVEGNAITGNSEFDDSGRPLYPENGFSLTAEYGGTGTLAATVRVKEGFAGKLEDSINEILKTNTGTLQIDKKGMTDSLKRLQDRIDREQTRLAKAETFLKAKFSRMEAILAQLQQQQAAISNM
jgi:flagellar capping protein FliD